MYLGELSPIQESQLVQLKSWVSELLKGKVPSDPILLRFLRARDFNVEKAREMLSQSLIWRKKHGVDKILSEYELPPVVNDYFPGGMFFFTLLLKYEKSAAAAEEIGDRYNRFIYFYWQIVFVRSNKVNLSLQ